jgi:anti-sigma factor RsiW
MTTELSCSEARDLACDLIDGELAPDQTRRLEAHIETCPTCPGLYRALVAVTNALRQREAAPEQ